MVGVVVPPLWSLQRDASTVLLSPEATFIVLNKEMYFSESNSEIGKPGGGGDCLQVKPTNDQLLCVVYAAAWYKLPGIWSFAFRCHGWGRQFVLQ